MKSFSTKLVAALMASSLGLAGNAFACGGGGNHGGGFTIGVGGNGGYGNNYNNQACHNNYNGNCNSNPYGNELRPGL